MSDRFRDRRRRERGVQAMQWLGQRTVEWPDWLFCHFPTVTIDRDAGALIVPTDIGDKRAGLQDWVVLDRAGLTVMSPVQFGGTYEAAA